MKAALCLSFCVVLAAAVKITPDTVERVIFADTLRDFPGVCFAYTQCRPIEVDKEWTLAPYCGVSKCFQGEDRLMELVKDCGLPPLSIDKCKVEVNETLPFPQCCPTYDCEPGVKLEIPKFPQIPTPSPVGPSP